MLFRSRSFTDNVVNDATVHAILDDARFAPSGGNRQPWRVALVKDRPIRHQLAAAMKPVWNAYIALDQTRRAPFAVVDGAGPLTTAPLNVPFPMLDNIDAVPLVLVVAADLLCIATMDTDLARPTISGGGSICPFCWSILRSTRDRSLAGVMPTVATRVEPVTGPLLGMPAGHALCTTIFLGHAKKQDTRLRRNPVETFAAIDRFDGDTLTVGV